MAQPEPTGLVSPRAAVRGRWALDPFWALTAGTFALALNLNVLAPLLPDLSRVFDASPETLGVLSAVYAIPQAVGAPLLGPLSDRWGRRPLLLVALLGFAVAGLAAALAPSLAWLALARGIAGLASSAYVPAAYAWIGDHVPIERRAAGISNMTIAAPIASLIILPLSGFLDVQFGWRAPFVVLSVIALVALWPLASLRDSPSRPRATLGVLGTYRAMCAAPGAVALILASVFFAVAMFGTTAFLGVYLVDLYGLSIAASGLVLGGLAAMRLAGNRIGARFADGLGHHRAVVVGLAGMAVGYALLGAPGVPLVVPLAGMALAGAAFQAGYPSQVTLVTNLSPAARGTAAAANTGLFYLGATLGPSLAGLVVGMAGALAIGWLGLTAALCGLALTLGALLQMRQPVAEDG